MDLMQLFLEFRTAINFFISCHEERRVCSRSYGKFNCRLCYLELKVISLIVAKVKFFEMFIFFVNDNFLVNRRN